MTRIVVRSFGAGLVTLALAAFAMTAIGATNDVTAWWVCSLASVGAFLFTFARQPEPEWSVDVDVRGCDSIEAAERIAAALRKAKP